MTYDAAISYFKTDAAIAEVLKISKQAVGQWKKTGKVPIKSAARLQSESKGKVKVDPKVYERANGRENAND